MDKCVHELAELTGQDDEAVEFTNFMADVPSCGLLKAVKDGAITTDQLNGKNGKSITVLEVKRISREYDQKAA